MQQQSIMGLAQENPSCDMSIEELLLHALVMEREAVQRYQTLAEMMELVGNTKVATIFAKMSKIEAKHVASIEERIADQDLPILTPSEYRWRGPESPENADSGRVYHLMTRKFVKWRQSSPQRKNNTLPGYKDGSLISRALRILVTIRACRYADCPICNMERSFSLTQAT